MQTKKYLAKLLLRPALPAAIAVLLFVLAAFLAFTGAKSYFAKPQEPAVFSYEADEGAYAYSDIKMCEGAFAKKNNVRYHFALDNYGGLLIIAVSEEHFNEKLSEIYQYTKAVTSSQPSSVRLTGYISPVSEELYALAREEWGADSFDAYFGSVYLDCEKDPFIYRLYIWSALSALCLTCSLTVVGGMIKKRVSFEKSFALAKTHSLVRETLIEANRSRSMIGKTEAITTKNFIFFPGEGAFYPYSEIGLIYRKVRKSLFNGSVIDFIVATKDKKSHLAAAVSQKEANGENVVDSIMENVMASCRDVLVGKTPENEKLYKALCSDK